jgi:hypothetical protein
MAGPQSVIAKDERDYADKAFRQWGGAYTRSDRSAVPEGYWYYLENFQPIGDGNLHTVPGVSTSLWNFGTDVVYYAQFAQLGAVPYLFVFTTNGKVFAYNFNTTTATQINSGNLLSGTGSRMAQWQTTYILFTDSTGYYYWNGSTFAKITVTGSPSAGTDIMVFSGRVWVSNGRLVLISAANDGTNNTDPTMVNAWSSTYGATFLNLTDPTLVGSVTRMWAQNGFGYIFGTTCVYAIADVYVPSGASPPTPVYTIVPIQSIIGTDQPASVFPDNQSLIFANRFGGYAINGVNALRFSEDIDGTWQYLSFNPSISGGMCVVNNILCTAFLLQRSSDPLFGSNTVIGLWFNKKWWFANFGTVTFICTAIINAVPTLCAFIGNQLYTLFTNAAQPPAGLAMTPLWDMGDPLSQKQVYRAGFLGVQYGQGSNPTINATVDGYNTSLSLQNSPITSLQFVNNSGSPITFTGSAAIVWTTFNAYQLYNSAVGALYSSAVGMTIKTTGVNMQITGVYMEYKLGARWQLT